MKVGDRVRLLKHGTAPDLVGREFTISEVYPPSTMLGLTCHRVMLEDNVRWLRADVENMEVISSD